LKLADKIALVTGGGRGIGKGCAIELAKNGADIILNDRPGSPDLEASASEIRGLGRTCTPIEANVFSRKGCEELIAKALDATGKIDILISNPARSYGGKFLEFPAEAFDGVIAGTLSAGFHVSQPVAQHMVERGGVGKIVFISSVQGVMPYGGAVAYNAAKAGVNHMARSIAVELAPHRINVNAIVPGWIDTPGEHEKFSKEKIDTEAAELPWGRMGLPSDIGKAAVFLSSDDADYITGTLLTVDGGFLMKDCGR
jgi:glucose 1-dehydrogenase